MKIPALVAYGAAVALCSPLSVITNTEAATAPSSNTSSTLQARGYNFGANAPFELYDQAEKARKAANKAPRRLEPGKWYYFMSCGLPADGFTFIKPRPPPKKGLPPRPESKHELEAKMRAQEKEKVWKSAQQRVKEQTGCEHVGFVIGKVTGSESWYSNRREFSAQLHYVQPRSTFPLKNAVWSNKKLETNQIPGNLKLVYGGMVDVYMSLTAKDYALAWLEKAGILTENPEEDELTFYKFMASKARVFHDVY
ncbi:hypothetical protein LZ30DRAFT_712388 [Colletotrichum cereale]|nr:hypothetical protein LZ30DRAFT_712388 [Colletotrichum cereale]